ncbi:MAG: arylesterase [Burkholderiales bacterium]
MRIGFRKLEGRHIRQIAALLILALPFALTMQCAYSASKTVLVLGDSISAEHGLARGTGWVALLKARLEAEKIDAVIINASIGGDTTSGGLSRLPPLLRQHPSVVLIELGGNDGLRGLPLSATEANLRSMIAAAQKAKAKVLLVGMQLPPNYGPDYTMKFAALYGKLAKETKSALVPFLMAGMEDKPQLFQADRIHPAAKAQPLILNNVWPALKPLLTK